MKRHELSDPEWELIADFFPTRPRRRGGQWKDDRAVLNAIFWRLRTGAPWRDLPERYGPWQTVYHRFNSLRRSGLLDRLIERLQLRLNEQGSGNQGLPGRPKRPRSCRPFLLSGSLVCLRDNRIS